MRTRLNLFNSTAVTLCSLGALAVSSHGCGVPEAAAPAAVQETRGALNVGAWAFQGPTGFNANLGSTTTFYSGAVTDIDRNFNNSRIATAVGGLFQWQSPTWIPISDALAPAISPATPAAGLSMGAMQTHPTNSNIILAGTGTMTKGNFIDGPAGPEGSGIYRTTDGGATWTNTLPLTVAGGSGNGSWVSKIEFNQTTGLGTVHAATSGGYYRSTDSGVTWTQVLVGTTRDLIRLANDTTLYAAQDQLGVVRSLDGGVTWTLVLRKNGVMSLAASGNVVFALGYLYGTTPPVSLYESTDGGNTWSSVSLPVSIANENCLWRSAIATNNGVNVLLGCDNLYRSQTGGTTWTQINSINVPTGINVIRFSSTTTAVSVGTSGGFVSSPDNGGTWFASANRAPTSDLYHFDVRLDSPSVYYAATSTEGAFSSVDGGASWHGFLNSPLVGKQFWTLVDPALGSQTAWLVDFNGNRSRTTDGGTTWTPIGTTLPGPLPMQSSAQIHHDQVPGVFLYTQAGSGIYQSTDAGVSWHLFPSTTFPALPGYPNAFAVGRWSGNSVVYVNTSTKIIVLDPSFSTTTWRDVTSVFPVSDVQPMQFAVSNTDPNVAFAFSGPKLWKTTDRAATWRQLKGKAAFPPGATILDILENPLNTSQLFAATSIGVFRSGDTGADWGPWKDGLPAGFPIAAQLHGSVVGSTFQVIAGIYGRGIWQRDAATDDP